MALLLRPVPPADEVAMGIASYLTATPGIGGRLRAEPEDFVVVELGAGPPRVEGGAHAAARVRLRNWETNRFVGAAAQTLGIHRDHIGFAGMKDKRAVTEQWFTFKGPVEALARLAVLQDVEVLETYATRKSHFAGAHTGNRFVLRVREGRRDPAAVKATVTAIAAEMGVPNYFGPQRFGGGFRPVTHLIGRAMVDGDLEEAVRLFVGNPHPGEREEARAARQVYEETRDPAQALAVFPAALDPERAVLHRLTKKPGDLRYALQALPQNLLQLFVHAHQSWLFNLALSTRLESGLGLRTAHVGDRVMGADHDGTHTHAVTALNQGRIQRELDLGRAVLTAPLVGMESPLADGRPGEVERQVLDAHQARGRDFRVRELPEVHSGGRRRGILQAVKDLRVTWVDGDPVFAFSLGKGAYATVVMREVMKDAGLASDADAVPVA